MVLDGIILMYGSLDASERAEASQDVSKITKQILSTLRFDATPVVVNSLKLLEALASDHAKEFIPDLGAIFPRIQRYMDDAKIAIRHHALKLGGALVVRLPFDIVGRFIFAAIEYKPTHPEISLKLAALSLLSISPSYSMSSNPLLSRIILIAGDYIDTSTNVFDSPRGNATSDVAKDTIALALMTLCFSSQHVQRDGSLPSSTANTVEDMLPVKLSTILGIPPQSPLSIELCRRAKSSDFPSLRQDSYLSGLATIAMEASLMSQTSAGNLAISSSTLNMPDAAAGSEKKKPNMSIKIPDFSVTPIKTNLNTPGTLENLTEESNNSSLRQLHFAPDNGGVSVLRRGGNEDRTGAPPIESYQPSWTPKDMGTAMDGPSPWAHPSNLPSSPITTPLDRSKLMSIKKGGRKPGSRLRARTADEALPQDDITMSAELAKMPATAGNDTVGRLTGVDSRKTGPGSDAYSTDSGRSRRLEQQQQQQQIQKIKITGRRGSRAAAISKDLPLAIPDTEYLRAQGFKKMETLEFSSDSDTEEGGVSESKRMKGVAVKKQEFDPFSTGGGLCQHSDEEEEDTCTRRREVVAGGEEDEEVKTFPANRRRHPSLDIESDFSVQGSSFQRQNSMGSQSNENNKSQSQVTCASQEKSDTGQEKSGGRGISNRTTGKAITAKRNNTSKNSNGNGNSNSNGNGNSNSNGNGNSNSNGNGSSNSNGNGSSGDGISRQGADHIAGVVNQSEHPSGQDVFDYLERAQLERCTKPAKDIYKAVKELTTADWPDIFYLLNTTRRLMIHHSAEVANSGQLHAIVLGLVKQVR
jgi:hypothetical protein